MVNFSKFIKYYIFFKTATHILTTNHNRINIQHHSMLFMPYLINSQFFCDKCA